MKYIMPAILCLIVILPVIVSAYTLLQPLPEGGATGKTEVTGLSDYLSWLYRFALGAVAFLAVLKIVIGAAHIVVGGASETAQKKGRDMIEMAIWGVLLAVTAWLILSVINPDLVTGKFELEPVVIEGIKKPSPAPTPTGPLGVFKNTTSPELTTFINCMKNYFPNLVITSTTDSDIATGKCNPTDPNETFNDDNNCVHTKYSCHYGGSSTSCIGKGSYAIDVDDNINYTTVAGAAADCGGVLGSHDVTAKCKNENGWYHISIGAWYKCGCDTSMASCASQD